MCRPPECSLGPLSRAVGFSKDLLQAGTMFPSTVPAYVEERTARWSVPATFVVATHSMPLGSL